MTLRRSLDKWFCQLPLCYGLNKTTAFVITPEKSGSVPSLGWWGDSLGDLLLNHSFFFLKIYLFFRETRGEEGQKERKSQADSPLSREPEAGLVPTSLRS